MALISCRAQSGWPYPGWGIHRVARAGGREPNVIPRYSRTDEKPGTPCRAGKCKQGDPAPGTPSLPLLPTPRTKGGEQGWGESVLEEGKKGLRSLGAARSEARQGSAGPRSLSPHLAGFWPRALSADPVSSEGLLAYVRSARDSCHLRGHRRVQVPVALRSTCPDHKNFRAGRPFQLNSDCYKCLKGLQKRFSIFYPPFG